MYTWGLTFNGNGDVSAVLRKSPTRVLTITDPIRAAALSDKAGLVQTTTGQLWFWGYLNNFGIGITPTAAVMNSGSVGTTPVTRIEAGSWHYLILTNNGILHSWGGTLHTFVSLHLLSSL